MPAFTQPASELALLRNAGLLLFGGAAATAVLAPSRFWLVLVAIAGAGLLFLAWRHLTVATAIWLVVTGATLEMVLSDLVGPQAFMPAIAVVKAAGLLAAGLAVLRFGPRLDLFNPALAWAAIFLAGWAHGLWPDLSASESLRSLAGSVAPFVFGFSRLSPAWAQAMIRTTRWVPLPGLIVGVALAAAGLHPLFIESGGMRLAGLSHPAFLAGVCQAAIYACLIEFYRTGSRAELAWLGLNLVVLVLTGARAPLLCAGLVVAVSLAFVNAPAVSAHARRGLLLTGTAVLPVLATVIFGLSGDAPGLRVLHLLAGDVTNLSGRSLLWPSFAEAAALSPWFGWGVGAGNAIIPPASEVARLLHTWAAHNEYLRVQVEGGRIGQALLIGSMILWVRRHSAALPVAERRIMRLVFLALSVHAITDNVLISTPACVLFTFAIAVFARGRHAADAARQRDAC